MTDYLISWRLPRATYRRGAVFSYSIPTRPVPIWVPISTLHAVTEPGVQWSDPVLSSKNSS
jgi:hypothetical protein